MKDVSNPIVEFSPGIEVATGDVQVLAEMGLVGIAIAIGATPVAPAPPTCNAVLRSFIAVIALPEVVTMAMGISEVVNALVLAAGTQDAAVLR